MVPITNTGCTDGVVLVADKRITIERGAEHKYSNKLFGDLDNIIIGFSGSRPLSESFRNDTIDYGVSYYNGFHEAPFLSILPRLDSSITLSVCCGRPS
jgi:20S proteasome alpha/beta subunit